MARSPNILTVAFMAATLILTCLASPAYAQSCTNPAWTQASSTGPSPRSDFGMAYDSARGRTVLFGGWNGSARMADTWEWDGVTWTQRIVGGPQARDGHEMVYDSVRGRVVLFGGNPGGPGFPRLGDTWEWDGTTWSLRSNSGPTGRSYFGMAYDSARNKTVVYGGSVVGNGTGFDTWEWDGNSWTQRVVNPNPGPRTEHSMAYDASRSRVVLLGGTLGGPLTDTWEWDGNAWSQRATSGPASVVAVGMAYHPGRGRVIAYGGRNGSVSRTSEWDGTAWTELAITGTGSRERHELAYDSARQRMVLFGGRNPQTFVQLGETWEMTCTAPPPGTFFDGTFTNSDWQSSVIVDTSPGAPSFITYGQRSAGGNPGFYRYVGHDYAGILQAAHLRIAAVHNPVTDGPIGSLDFSYDFIITSAFSPLAEVGFAPLVKQGDTYYGCGGPNIAAGGWRRVSQRGLSAGSFGRIAGPGPLYPDFSSTGAPIVFGYVTSNSAGDITDPTHYFMESGVDNWAVTVNPPSLAYSDSIFNDADWQVVLEGLGNGGSVSASQVATGGAPDQYRRIVLTTNTAPPGGQSTAFSYHRRLGAIYDPATQGALGTIDYTESSRMFTGFGGGQGAGPALTQGGVNYYHLPVIEANEPQWTAHSFTGVRAQDFHTLADFNRHPDFSATGAPITFGFFRGNGTCVNCGGYTIDAGIDNWSVTLHPAPPCQADLNGDGQITSQDFFNFLTAFFAGLPAADFNGDGQITSQDFFNFLVAFFAGC